MQALFHQKNVTDKSSEPLCVSKVGLVYFLHHSTFHLNSKQANMYITFRRSASIIGLFTSIMTHLKNANTHPREYLFNWNKKKRHDVIKHPEDLRNKPGNFTLHNTKSVQQCVSQACKKVLYQKWYSRSLCYKC